MLRRFNVKCYFGVSCGHIYFPFPQIMLGGGGGVKGIRDISKVDTFEIEERAKHR